MDETMMYVEAGLTVFYLVVYGISMLVSIAVYIVSSLSLYSIADRRGIGKPWLAWIPIGNLWILGSISDHYQRRAHNTIKVKRKTLMWLTVAIVALYVVMIVAAVICVITALDAGYNNYNGDFDLVAVLGSFGVLILIFVVMAGVAVALSIVQYICYYDLFRSCDPDNAVLFLVLSIVVSFTLPIFLLLCKNKDDGLPKRYVPVVPPTPEYTYNTNS